jgi:Ni,Fe-hydrogenase maturation factor
MRKKNSNASIAKDRSMNLYELTSEYARLRVAAAEILAAEANGETTPEFPIELLERVEGALSEKVKNIGLFLREQDENIEMLDREIERLSHRKKVMQNVRARVAEWLEASLKSSGLLEVSDPLITVSLRKCPPSVNVVRPEAIPAEFVETRVEKVVKKSEILRHFKNTGEVVPGAEIVTDKRVLSIR